MERKEPAHDEQKKGKPDSSFSVSIITNTKHSRDEAGDPALEGTGHKKDDVFSS